MSHLPSERLAALADEQPTVAEAEHLSACRLCAREREAQRGLLRLAAAEIGRETAPLTTWDSIAAGLRDEGLLAWRPRSRPLADNWWMRLAASLLLLVGGVVAGRMSAGGEVLEWSLGRADVDIARVPDIGTLAEPQDDVVREASQPADFRSTEEALQALHLAEQQYQRAATFLARHDSEAGIDESADAIRARLAALDAVAAATRAALYEAPHDPVINRYYLTTLGARQATLQQLGTALPAGYGLASY
jgi:hypothetical protein